MLDGARELDARPLAGLRICGVEVTVGPDHEKARTKGFHEVGFVGGEVVLNESIGGEINKGSLEITLV